MRTFKTIAIVAVAYLVAIILEVMFSLSSPDYEGGVTVLVLLGFLAFFAPKVGYRWFDCFFVIIPFYGIFFIFRIAYRVANLPMIDWEVRNLGKDPL